MFTPPYRPQHNQWTAVVWDVATSRELARMNLTDKAFGPGQTVDMSNERIAVVLPLGTVRLYDLKTGKEQRLAEADQPPEVDDARPMGGAVAVRFRADGRTLIVAGPAEQIRFWNVSDRKKSREIASSRGGIERMDVSPRWKGPGPWRTRRCRSTVERGYRGGDLPAAWA